VCLRIAAVVAALCLALASTRASAGDGVAKRDGPSPRASRVVALAEESPPIYGAAPTSPEIARATFVYLHGVCGLTTNGCPHFEDAPGWLVCPQANQTCANGGSSWGGPIEDKLTLVDRAVAAARTRWPESARSPVVLVGFSQGAYVAMEIARARPGAYAGLLLLGADTGRAVDRLRASHALRIARTSAARPSMAAISATSA